MVEENSNECVILTPKGKRSNATVLLVERRCHVKNGGAEDGESVHVAGGEHRGIIVNKTVCNGQHEEETICSDISLEFRVYLVNAQTGAHTQESRTLRYWFKNNNGQNQHSGEAQRFFRHLIGANDFPKDYVGFVKKIMKLMQTEYPTIQKLEIELKQLEQVSDFPKRPLSSGDESSLEERMELTEKKLLELIESSYPNPVTIQEISAQNHWDEEEVKTHLDNLREKDKVKALDYAGAFTRVVQDDTDVQIVKQMPTIANSKQPTIAIITAQYSEKVAVDALIENKETYVRYTTVGGDNSSNLSEEFKSEKTAFSTRIGESNVYTLGNIGPHRVVCTKLPTTGHTREAMIAAGNTTTRLLGTFQKVDYVILVGVGGGVAHYTDYKKHVRLGDVVVSDRTKDKNCIYTYCESAEFSEESNSYEFECKEYAPADFVLQEIAFNLKRQWESDEEGAPWLKYLEEGVKKLKGENVDNFERPCEDSDKLYMNVGDKTIIEVAHPMPPDGKIWKGPRIHLGPVASGRAISRDEELRQVFALQKNTLAFDSECDSVIEAVIGSRRESFIVIRGVADYKDGTRRSEWQGFASISAAAVCKALVSSMIANA